MRLGWFWRRNESLCSEFGRWNRAPGPLQRPQPHRRRTSALTGESMPAEKTAGPASSPPPPLLDCPCLALMGMHVVSGGRSTNKFLALRSVGALERPTQSQSQHCAATCTLHSKAAAPCHTLAGTGLCVVVATGQDVFLATVASTLQHKAGGAGQNPECHTAPHLRPFPRLPLPVSVHAFTLQKPSNAFQLGVQRVSYLLIAFMAAMVPLVVASSSLMTRNWGQARRRGWAAIRQQSTKAVLGAQATSPVS